MNIETIISILTAHNPWRKVGEGEQADPATLGKALKAAIRVLKSLSTEPAPAGYTVHVRDYVPYQSCPLCAGSSRVPGDGMSTEKVCPVCEGKRIIPMHPLKKKAVKISQEDLREVFEKVYRSGWRNVVWPQTISTKEREPEMDTYDHEE